MRDQQRKLSYKFLAALFLPLCSTQLFAQEHLIQRPEHQWLQLTEEQYMQGAYQLATQSATEYLAQSAGNIITLNTENKTRAKYFLTLSQLKLDTKGVDDSASNFLISTNNPAYQQRVSFALAQYFFKHEELQKAIPYYESVNIANLTNDEIADSKFELAYCYFNSRQFEKAEPLLNDIKEVPGNYYMAGNYYYGLLAYNGSKYEEALKSFKRIDNESQYKNIVPYYIAEIYYFKGDRKKALEEAIRLTRKTEKNFYDNELYLLAAQVLFEEQRYGEALPYFEHYYDETAEIRKEDLYEMAYSYYRVNEWKNAIEKFKPLSNTQDSLGQTAMYLLGDCYLRTNNKKSARNAFSISADMEFNQAQQEASLLLFGKLSYELGYNDDAKRSFKNLIQYFPKSTHVSEAKTYLSDLLIKTNNYTEAYDAMKTVSVKNTEYWRVHQKVTYGLAMQQLKNNSLVLADNLLAESLQQTSDGSYEAAAYFWKGEIAYRQHQPANAVNYLKKFIDIANNKTSPISPSATITNAYLNLGYASMELEDYTAAQNYFSKASLGANTNSNVAMIASVREADAAFMQKNYNEAQNLYDKAIASNSSETDYAILQKSILLGVQGKANDKISLLQQLINKQPASKYTSAAQFELANTYIEDDKYQQAIIYLQALTTNPEARNYAAKAWMKLGFVYQELNNDDKAIASYKHVITDFPAGEDRTNALAALRSLYIEDNQPEAYARFIKDNNLPSIGSGSLDSTYYAAAEAQIASGKWENAKTTLTQYLEKYPNGNFTTKAHYYKGESHNQLKEMNAALTEYDAVLALPWNEFSESSAKRAAKISFAKPDYKKAGDYYYQLRTNAMSSENLQLAYSGLMRASYNENKFEDAAKYADTLLQMPEVTPTIMNEVQFFKAKSLQKSNNYAAALEVYNNLQNVTNEAVSGEARYRIAELYFLQNNLKETETAANNAINLNTGSDYWVVKSYMLIGDILIKQKDYFNAKATFQSIIKNTKNVELKTEATQKLEEAKRLEKQKTKLKAE